MQFATLCLCVAAGGGLELAISNYTKGSYHRNLIRLCGEYAAVVLTHSYKNRRCVLFRFRALACSITYLLKPRAHRTENQTNKNTCMQTYMHTYIHPWMHAYARTRRQDSKIDNRTRASMHVCMCTGACYELETRLQLGAWLTSPVRSVSLTKRAGLSGLGDFSSAQMFPLNDSWHSLLRVSEQCTWYHKNLMALQEPHLAVVETLRLVWDGLPSSC